MYSKDFEFLAKVGYFKQCASDNTKFIFIFAIELLLMK